MTSNLKFEIINKEGKRYVGTMYFPVPIESFLTIARYNGILGSHLFVDDDGTEIHDSLGLEYFIRNGKTIFVDYNYKERKEEENVAIITDFSRGKRIARAVKKSEALEDFIKYANNNRIKGKNAYIEENGAELRDSISLQKYLEKGKNILVGDCYEEREKALLVVITDISRKRKIARAFEKPVSPDQVIRYANAEGITAKNAFDEKNGTQLCCITDLKNCVERENSILIADEYQRH